SAHLPWELSQPCVPLHIWITVPLQSTTLWKSGEQPTAQPPLSGTAPSNTKFIPPIPLLALVAPPVLVTCVEAPPVLLGPVVHWTWGLAEHAEAMAAGRTSEARSTKGKRRKARGWLTATLLEKSSGGGSAYAQRSADGNGGAEGNGGRCRTSAYMRQDTDGG